MDTRELDNLRLTTPRLVLDASGARLEQLVRVADAGIHDPASQPFGAAWTDDPNPGEQVRAWWHRQQEQSTPDDWRVPFIVSCGDVVIGQQSLYGKNFSVLNEVSTGSWLGREFQGCGFGTEMRAAVLNLAFAGLGALFARTTVHADNLASRGVTSKLGYWGNGSSRVIVRGAVMRELHFELPCERWAVHRVADKWPTEIHGLDQCAHVFGVKP